MVIQNNMSKGNILSIKALVNKKTITCLIDTGSTYSIITQQLVKKLSLKSEETENVVHQTASNHSIESGMISKYHISFSECPNAQYNMECLIVPTLPVDFIIGSLFLNKNEANICYREETLRLVGFTYNLQ
ncbi:hypothetical protein DMUE_4946 [Dictyocoela muelleri]|nr:hypothetical protein DMUE_4946 [Dictyocoela muelleri]